MFPGMAYQPLSPFRKSNKSHPTLPPDLARPGIAPMPFESPNARSKTITVADGPNTGGYLLKNLELHPNSKIPSVLNKTFHAVDSQLSQMAAENKTHSGCTAVAAFLRIEDELGGQAFREAHTTMTDEPTSLTTDDDKRPTTPTSKPSASGRSTPSNFDSKSGHQSPERSNSSSKLRSAVKNFTSKLSGNGSGGTIKSEDGSTGVPVVKGSIQAPFEPCHDGWGFDVPSSKRSKSSASDSTSLQSSGPPSKRLRRVLYAANAGDARAVLCRNGEALRLTYDHKGSDAQESKRITDAGGFVMNNRVNGVLAVTRSLGDSAMKDFVVGAPYTTETEVGPADEFIIIACDGLWDVTEDQEAVNLVRDKSDAQQMAKLLLEHALVRFSSDNVTVMVVRFKPVSGSS
ncbi:Protein phosphatase 2C homolog 1 Short=PP2C-1 [Serendipita indica DSM 11827]|nr:Protein phosphatase 2C homolog 1 Short=PP2C-1 [Serendipita indica DSM 11827]